MIIPTEPIGSIARPVELIDALARKDSDDPSLVPAAAVQIDFTEGRLAIKMDPSGHLLNSFIDLNNLALARFSPDDRRRIGVHMCPGGDRDSTHGANVDYQELLSSLFQLRPLLRRARPGSGSRWRPADHPAAHETRADDLRRRHRAHRPAHRDRGGDPRPGPRGGALHPGGPARHDRRCGFSPFSDDASTTRDAAFAKVGARVRGTALAGETLSRP